MTTADLLQELGGRGVVLTALGDRLRVDAPAGALGGELRAELARRKREVIDLLASAGAERLPPEAWAGGMGGEEAARPAGPPAPARGVVWDPGGGVRVSDPPDSLTPRQREDELCALLGAGVRRRLSLRIPPVSAPPLDTSESSRNGLDVAGESGLHVSRGVNANREPGRS